MIRWILISIGFLMSLIVIISVVVYFLPEKKKLKYPVDKEGIMILKHSIEINTLPHNLWQFIINIDKNYKTWHPGDHLIFNWTKGEPWVKGSEMYSEQYMGGQLVKYNGLVTEAIPNEIVVFQFAFPISIINPKNEFVITAMGASSVFTGVTYLKFNKIFRIIFNRQIEEMVEAIEKHTAVENENMKRILEGK